MTERPKIGNQKLILRNENIDLIATCSNRKIIIKIYMKIVIN